MRGVCTATIGLLWFLVSSLGSSSMVSSQVTAAERLSVTVSIAPQQYFLQQIAGDQLDILVMLDRGGDPHTYESTPQQRKTVAGTALFFAAGLSVESTWQRELLSGHNQMRWIESGTQTPDQHFWLSPPLVRDYIDTVVQALIEADPDSASIYAAGALDLSQRVEALDESFRRLFSHTAGRKTFVVAHNAWTEFAEAYGLVQLVIEAEGKSVTPRHLAQIIQRAKDLEIDTVFADQQHGVRHARTVATALDAELIMLNPVSENWLDDLTKAATLIGQNVK